MARQQVAAARLPKYYQALDGQEIEAPVYLLLNPGFYDGVLWPKGEILCTNMQPNRNLRPLNQKAAENMDEYVKGLPGGDGPVLSLSDMVEAATMLRPKEGEAQLSPTDYAKAVRDLAVQISEQRKLKRQAKIPSAPYAQRANSSDAPPLPNAVYQQGPTTMAGNQRPANAPPPNARSMRDPNVPPQQQHLNV